MSALLSTQPALGACKSYQARRSAAKAASVCACKASVQHLQPTNIVYQHQIQESEQIGQLSRHTHKAEQQHLTAWQWQCAFIQSRPLSHTAAVLLGVATCLLQFHVLTAGAAELQESSIQAEGNVPSELSAAGEQQGPRLSSLMQGTNKKQIEGCTRRCVPTCIRGGEGSPGLGPITLRKEIVVFKDGFRSRQYCLSECAQVCALMSDSNQQQQQQQQQQEAKQP